MARRRLGLRGSFVLCAESADNGGSFFTEVVVRVLMTGWYWIAGVPELKIPPDQSGD